MRQWWRRTHSSNSTAGVSSRVKREKGEGLTGAERVVGALELLAGGKVITLGSDAFEVVGIVLEAAEPNC